MYMLFDSLIRKAYGFLNKVLQEIMSLSVILCLFIQNSLFIHNITWKHNCETTESNYIKAEFKIMFCTLMRNKS